MSAGSAEIRFANKDDAQSLTAAETALLNTFLEQLQAYRDRDPKFAVVRDLLLGKDWLSRGCIIFSQYFDSVSSLAEQLSEELPQETIAIYAGAQKSGLMVGGAFTKASRDRLKSMIRRRELRLVLGTDAASEGLNLQSLGTLINLDLPWNPTRLEQRKGRIQRIGQLQDTVFVYNMRYRDSVEDRVHALLSSRLQSMYQLFGQIPDVLEDVWVDVALGQIERARETIGKVPDQHPFEVKYHKIEKVPWESCARVLEASTRKEHLLAGW